VDLGEVQRLYERSLAEHGAASPGVGWPDPAAHRARLEQLLRVLELAPPPARASCADLGCGYGALFDLLAGRLGTGLARYDGYDISAAMLAAARARVDDPRARWLHGARIERTVDYAFACGTFNVRLDAEQEPWARYVREAVREMHARSRCAIAFNVLSAHVDWRADHLFYADPAEWLDWALRELSPRAALAHDYGLHEWTLIVLR
jgi:SAM-dependent methyltransferase